MNSLSSDSQIECPNCTRPVSNIIDTWGSGDPLSVIIHECPDCSDVTGVFHSASGSLSPADIEVRAPNRAVYDALYGENPRVFDCRKAGKADFTESGAFQVDKKQCDFDFTSGHCVREGDTLILPTEAYNVLIDNREDSTPRDDGKFRPDWLIRQNIRVIRAGTEAAASYAEAYSLEEDYQMKAEQIERVLDDAIHTMGPRHAARVTLSLLSEKTDAFTQQLVTGLLDELEDKLL